MFRRPRMYAELLSARLPAAAVWRRVRAPRCALRHAYVRGDGSVGEGGRAALWKAAAAGGCSRRLQQAAAAGAGGVRWGAAVQVLWRAAARVCARATHAPLRDLFGPREVLQCGSKACSVSGGRRKLHPAEEQTLRQKERPRLPAVLGAVRACGASARAGPGDHGRGRRLFFPRWRRPPRPAWRQMRPPRPARLPGWRAAPRASSRGSVWPCFASRA